MALQGPQDALLKQGHSWARLKMRERELLEQNQERHQAMGFHVHLTGERGHARQDKTGLSDTFGMGNMKGASEGN